MREEYYNTRNVPRSAGLTVLAVIAASIALTLLALIVYAV